MESVESPTFNGRRVGTLSSAESGQVIQSYIYEIATRAPESLERVPADRRCALCIVLNPDDIVETNKVAGRIVENDQLDNEWLNVSQRQEYDTYDFKKEAFVIIVIAFGEPDVNGNKRAIKGAAAIPRNNGMFGVWNAYMSCRVCGERNGDKRCSRCKAVHYCGSACQSADWKRHKPECVIPALRPAQCLE